MTKKIHEQPSTSTTQRVAAEEVFDIVGIGIGPFNLGMAALAHPLVQSNELKAIFFDENEAFCWHPGVMFSNSTIQVPFMADLVSLADPTSPWSFLNYLKRQGRIYQFYIRESFYPYRTEYSDYCAWVADQLSTLQWSSPVTNVHRTEDGLWRVQIGGKSPRAVLAKNLVNGTGTQPYVPTSLQPKLVESRSQTKNIIHSSDFLFHAERLSNSEDIQSLTIVGSGQSAAEIYRHLMEPFAATGRRLNWLTRSPRFFPMEYTALTLELTSTDYVRHFHRLPEARRDQINRQQRNLYKGISGDLVNDIYDTLYQLSITTPLRGELRPDVTVELFTESDLKSSYERHINEQAAESQILLKLTNNETGNADIHATDAVILATGYGRPAIPSHLITAAEAGEINTDKQGRLDVNLDFTVNQRRDLYVLNAEEHTHSLNAPDLGMGAWRNSIILNNICGRTVYEVEDSWTFQQFGGENV